MIIKESGEISDDLYVIGPPAIPVYLLDGLNPVIFDAGFTALAHEYETCIKEILGDRKPAYLFLTHSHFDHIGAVSHFKSIWPKLQIAGSVRCHEILLKQKAIKLIRDLNLEGTKNLKKMGIHPLNEQPFEPFDIDILITPDQKIELSSDIIVTAFNTPGHTWDFMSYWIPKKKILIASEAVACCESNGYLQPEFLVDFDAYLLSLRKIKNLDAKILCAGHHAVFTGKDAPGHIQASVKAANDYLTMTQDFLVQEKGNLDCTVLRIKAVEWDNRPWPKQPESAYLLNTSQRVKIIWERMNKHGGDHTMTITRIKTINEIKPIFREYLDYMSQFFLIHDIESWCKGALKNLQRDYIADDRYIYILKKSDSIIGFAMVNKHLRFNSKGFAVAEFYIQKNHEQKGYGRKLAEHVFEKFPGSWEVAVSIKNKSALVFWKQVVSSYTEGKFNKKWNASFRGYGFVFNTGFEK